jgi:hypothetical protein
MINLKLAEYNKDGKFQGFMELSRTDLSIFISSFDGDPIIDSKGDGFLLGKERVIVFQGVSERAFMLDKKDPLNRFNGLFDGRTYGQGDFVLIQDDEDDIIQMGQHNYQRKFDDSDDKLHYLGAYILGNLHENPELYEKIK